MKKLTVLILALMLGISMMTAASAEPAAKPAKYVFFFIGDGMGAPQISATQYYLGTKANPDAAMPTPEALSFTGFKNVGVMTTYDATSFCPDSASTASSSCRPERPSPASSAMTSARRRPSSWSAVRQEAGGKVGVISQRP